MLPHHHPSPACSPVRSPVRSLACSLRKSGFTLIELLVSIAILSLLATMLLSAVNVIRYQVGQVVCLSNMRQIGMGTLAYESDHQGRIMSPCGKNFWMQYADWGYPTWDRVLIPYLGNDTAYDPTVVAPNLPTPTSVRVGVYRCGLDKTQEVDGSGARMARGIQRRSYMMNFGARNGILNTGRGYRPTNVYPIFPGKTFSDIVLLGDRFSTASNFDFTMGWVGGTFEAPWGWHIAPGDNMHPRGDTNFLYMDMHAANFRDWSGNAFASSTWYMVNGDPF